MKMKTLPIFLVFLCMGFGDVVGPLVGLAKNTFQLSYTMAQLIPFVGFIMFGLLSVPMGIYQDKKGKKFILMLGLIVALVGLIVPMLNGMYGGKVEFFPGEYFSFYLVLLSILLLCAGATILQVVGNPVMRDVSPEGAYSKNLSFAQSIKAVGSSLGFLLPPFVAIVFGLEWSILFPVFSVLILITLFLSMPLKIEEHKNPDSKPATISSCLSLLKNGYVLLMVIAIFFYVGAEVSMSSSVPILLYENFGIRGFSLWVSWAIFFLPIIIGRFTGSLILSRMPAKKFFVLSNIISIIGVAVIFSSNEVITYIGIILVGLGFSNIFPLIFSITIDRMPDRSNELSGLMITAIAGGAIVPLVMGQVADLSSILTSFIVPLLCLFYIAYTSFISIRKEDMLTSKAGSL
ncbi:MAG: MFS transporter [Ignavibacteria bacterium GWA2_35_9]|nr:MAG: MFS transporter [Ignavibacteria bacterium GWA2_35_9]OGU43200.1 MAG: MFS transporter [Ignavibacteria bacterium GWB2_36_8]OGU52370.1 MAG: MFS transporter [Ignavibacteria bacterium GWC2_36_12]OGU97548.1 MAG: MFS transporter [Ignavibacteria bacterium RIFOXYB2_FULL_36_7]